MATPFTEFNAASLKRGGSAYLGVRVDYPTGDLESLEASYPYLGR